MIGGSYEWISLTVADVLTKKSFSSAKLLAGAQGQLNVIKWVNSAKNMDATKLVKGNELILTTDGLPIPSHNLSTGGSLCRNHTRNTQLAHYSSMCIATAYLSYIVFNAIFPEKLNNDL